MLLHSKKNILLWKVYNNTMVTLYWSDMMSKILKIILCIAVIILVGGLSYTFTSIYYSLDIGTACSTSGVDEKGQIIARLEKMKEVNKYYIKIIQNSNPTGQASVTINCTKKQYDFLKMTGTYHIMYKRSFFHKDRGKLLKFDTKPIMNGKVKIAGTDS